ncbi:MAG TPA: hypothetical protein DEG43_03625 [Acidimicrobiaceae bacterium]|jgi:hypothetical protein|nr:hypothetical protein [Acidimicrobiaceae bacterium]
MVYGRRSEDPTSLDKDFSGRGASRTIRESTGGSEEVEEAEAPSEVASTKGSYRVQYLSIPLASYRDLLYQLNQQVSTSKEGVQ